ncbi:coatamer alpha subunit [Naegleria gruberi]|uniref:Coatomer subunit alpha n=1 Tax=Naegleria gruberi TaxID=5762 RepID=D2VA89_NAEGR|nr:coatamer alpha subunit [Naegleria gruberi]EFC46387.1 coatamer alpha subunit [Naegleria gruberi]|eukprot:XP_002679131.1 coatamer alpha subunit [Naegleria gruberi strain NEG-M]
MIIKFETKSQRVKGLSFHPKRSWILASLHTGAIQLWDYRMGTMIDSYLEHEGPVRGLDFHSTQPLFVSGGDDYKIKVWNYKLRRCLFTLTGHYDYVRTVEFHREQPWIISASDDQTIRIWNWQSRTCISVLPGHNHYVMSASFHPKQDLVVSASLDQSIRVWDISALKQKNANVGMSPGDEFLKLTQLNQEFFNSGDAMVKYVLDGHDRGVNYAVFHPKTDMIVSASDDRTVRTWKVSDQRAWAVDTFSGHGHNVSCAVFHEKKDMIISASEDKTLRFYDIGKSQFIRSYKREYERFWVLDVHPTQNLIAAGHDGGLIVFKLERERPAFTASKNCLMYMKEKNLRVVKGGKDAPAAVLRKSWSGSTRNLCIDPTNTYGILTSDHDGGSYELFEIKKGPTDEVPIRNPIRKGKALFAAFVGLQKFATLDPKDRKIFIHSTQSDRSKELPITVGPIKRIFPAVSGRLIFTTDDRVHLYDLEQQKIVSSHASAGIKFVVWSDDNSKVALLGKHLVVVCDSNLQPFCTTVETIRIKSGAFDKDGVFIYTTLNHMKYCLASGDFGTIKTLDLPIYIAHIENNNVTIIDREGTVKVITIDATEYRFKLALSQGRTGDIKKIIGEAKILGDSIIAYLQQKGYPEIALKFVEDESTKFNLALECGDIKTASEVAQKLDKKECWNSLGLEALNQGDVSAVEKAYQRTKNVERLSFLHSVTGNQESLKLMLKIANSRNDVMSRFHNALFLGDVEERVKVLQSVGQSALAYMTAKNHGLDALAEEVKKSLSEDFKMPEFNFKPSLFLPPVPINAGGNWPLLHTQEIDYGDVGQSLGEIDELEFDQFGDSIEIPGMEQATTSKKSVPPPSDLDEMGEDQINVDDYDLIDIPADAQISTSQSSNFVPPNAGRNVLDMWPVNSQFPGNHIAAGSFDSAIEILQKAVGIKNFAPLKELFLSIYAGSNLLMPSPSCQPSIPLALQAGKSENERSRENTLPKLAVPTLSELQLKLKDALNALSNQNTIKNGLDMLREIMRQLLFLPILSKKDEREFKETLSTCCEYVSAFRMELDRKDIMTTDSKRAAELAAYFTRCKLRNNHIMLGLNSAMAICFKLENFVTAATFANRLLKMGPPEKIQKQAAYVAQQKESKPTDKIELNYDDRNPFVVCNISHTPIYQGSDKIACSYCGAAYLPRYDGELCTICEMGTIGKKLIGLYAYANAFKNTPMDEEEEL